MTRSATRRRQPAASVTIDDVARTAGVSRATASRVVNNRPNVRAEARAAVLGAVERLGYVPNRAARALMTRRSDSIGVIVMEPTGRLFEDPFFGHLLAGISEGLADADQQLVLMVAQTADEVARVERYLAAGHLDGAVLVGPHGSQPFVRRLHAARVPLMLSGRAPDDLPVSYVDSDNRGGARLAVTHLAALGRRRIATIHGSLDLSSGADRLAGYQDGLDSVGLPVDEALVIAGDFDAVVAGAAMRALLARCPDVDAVFAASDTMAAAAVRALLDANRRIPDDVAVVGFDDTPLALSTRPTLSTVRQPIADMGREITRLLLRRIENPDDAPRQVVFTTELVVRESSGGAGA